MTSELLWSQLTERYLRDVAVVEAVSQVTNGEVLGRVDELVAENNGLTEKLRASTQDNSNVRKQITELDEDTAAERTALRRMIREQSSSPTTVRELSLGSAPRGQI